MKSGNPYILFYKKKNFELKNSDDFEQIKQKSTGSCDNLFEEAKSNQDQISIWRFPNQKGSDKLRIDPWIQRRVLQ